jgi:hypothetical protein
MTDEEFARLHEESVAAVARCRAERGIDPHHDSGADSGALSEDEERARSERGR